MRLQKYRGLSRSTISNVPGLKPYFPPKIIADPEFVLEWLIHEDYALLQVSVVYSKESRKETRMYAY